MPKGKTRKSKTKKTGNRLKKVEKKVNELYNEIETKVLGTLSDASGVIEISSIGITNAVPTVLLLNGMARGTAQSNRIGEKVKFTGLEMGLQFYSTSSMISQWQVRVMLVREKTALGSLASLSGLFGDATPAPHYTRNYATRDAERYSVLWDRSFVISPYASSLNGAGTSNNYNTSTPSTKRYMIKKKLNFITNYARGDTGTVTDIETNTFQLIVFTDGSTSNALDMYGTYNLFFRDA